jgi:hypothetical protein
LRSTVDFLEATALWAVSLVKNFNLDEIVNKIKGKAGVTKVDREFNERYRLTKGIVVVNENNTIYGLSSEDGSVKWKQQLQANDRIESFERLPGTNPITGYEQVAMTYSTEDGHHVDTTVDGGNGSFTHSSKRAASSPATL